jgi:hypothetical protein
MASKLQPFAINDILKKALFSGSRFSRSYEERKPLVLRKEELKEAMGGSVSSVWIVFCILGIFAVIALGIYEAFIAKTAIASLIDPTGNGVIPEYILTAIGAALAVTGLLLGHGLYESVSQNPHTGHREVSGLFVPCLFACIFFVGYQVFLVMTAGHTTAPDNTIGGNMVDVPLIDEAAGLKYLPYVVGGIALLEILVGVLLLHKSFIYANYIGINVLLAGCSRKIERHARNTDSHYRDYLVTLDAYNGQTGVENREREGSANIFKAIRYYGGEQGVTYPGVGQMPAENGTPAKKNDPAAEKKTEPPQAPDEFYPEKSKDEDEVEKFVDDYDIDYNVKY